MGRGISVPGFGIFNFSAPEISLAVNYLTVKNNNFI